MSNADYDFAVQMQRMAANPSHSVFVSANAGSGKTRVLVERVSRLLLAGTKPDKILCLTYTKAAASEMQSRLFEALGTWAVMGQDDLTHALNAVEGRDRVRDEKELGRARLLFARALETPGGLKVQTIHAFCEKLLRRFPLEAGLAPGTDAIDEPQARELQTQVWTRIELEAVQNPESEIACALTVLAAEKNDEQLEKLYVWAMGNVYKMRRWKEAGGVNALAELLGITPDLTVDGAKAEAWLAAPEQTLRSCLPGFLAGGKRDIKRAEFAEQALLEADPVRAYEMYLKTFFAGNGVGNPFKPVASKQAAPDAKLFFGNDKECPSPEVERLSLARDKVRAAAVLKLTKSVYILAQEAANQYADLKIRRRVMDFEDQIHMARRLLLDSEAQDWVRYKLDGGVDHVLVDEAQDTSGVQWDIIGALSDPFFQPAPDADPNHPRTLFAVGDEKQSIYGFQGAEPELFLKKIQELTQKQADTPEVKMSMSFRSTQQILNLVDEIFYTQGAIQATFEARNIPPASDISGHKAHRDDVGVVEFWPAIKAPEKPDPEVAWEPVPVDTPSAQSPREQLARNIAMQIKYWLDREETVFDRKTGLRPMQARDIMILVTSRSDFFNGVIRNLKEQGVPVAGADRLALTDSIAVQDLLSLAKFTLLPADDLSLAEVLKSPLFGWSEDALFAIAAARSGSLWDAVPEGETRTILSWLLGLAKHTAPYEFFARALAHVPNANGPSLLQNMYTRLGIEVADAIEAFLARALAHQRRGAPSLIRFVRDIETDGTKIKREMDTVQNEVRVMTVHAAKGLEAPVVILPDTTQIKSVGKEMMYAITDNGGYVMRVPAGDQPSALAHIEAMQQEAVARESLRLLYVALTRAESRLLVCGYESHGKVADDSWHDRIGKAMTGLDATEFRVELGEDTWTALRYGQPILAAAHTPENRGEQGEIAPASLPEWARSLSSPAPKGIRHFSPSKLIGAEEKIDTHVPVRSPLMQKTDTVDRFSRGNHIHKLLQILPDLDVSKRHEAAQTYLRAVAPDTAEEIEAEVFAVLENPEFAPFFASTSPSTSSSTSFGGPEVQMSMAEVSLAGHAKNFPAHIRLSGQIDRLCVIGDCVWILDYKSNRPPPMREQDVAMIYVRQMAAYRALAQDIFPEKTVRTALLWTDGPRLMPLSDGLLDTVDWDMVLPS